MPPNAMTSQENVLSYDLNNEKYSKICKDWNCYEHLYWSNIIYFIAIHTASLYGLYLCFTQAHWYTIAFALFLYNITIFGITAGVHRLWSHRSYKTNLPLRIILIICQTISYQNSVYEWARDHRVHHKYTETDADPLNSNRGFFFAHCGWLMCKKHPEVIRLGLKVDLNDLYQDGVVMFQKKHYVPLLIVGCFAMPTLVPWYYWGESLWNAYFVCVMLRYVAALNGGWLVNSAAHKFGYKPYDVHIAPAQNIGVSALTLGEGWHNFHHAFPWDYRASEWGWNVNGTTIVLDLFAIIGWVTDRRYVTKDMIEMRKTRTGPTAGEKYQANKFHEF